MIKLHKCECEFAIFPFGSGTPVCIRVMQQTRDRKDLRQCTEKGCKYYHKINNGKEEKKEK
jgi:hypothetical protein